MPIHSLASLAPAPPAWATTTLCRSRVELPTEVLRLATAPSSAVLTAQRERERERERNPQVLEVSPQSTHIHTYTHTHAETSRFAIAKAKAVWTHVSPCRFWRHVPRRHGLRGSSLECACSRFNGERVPFPSKAKASTSSPSPPPPRPGSHVPSKESVEVLSFT